METMDEVSTFMSDRQMEELPEDELQWKIWFVQDFRDGESLLVFKMHHVVADGLGMLILLACL